MIVDKPQDRYSRIDEPLYILDNGTLLEQYELKSIRKTNILGTFDYNVFRWNPDMSENFFERRGNFENITFLALVDAYGQYVQLPNDFKDITPVSNVVPNTYEVSISILKSSLLT